MRRPSGYLSLLSTLGLVVLVCGIYFGPQLITYYKLRSSVFRPVGNPPRGWSSVPRPLTDMNALSGEGSTISHYGYTFEVPWKGSLREQEHARWFTTQFGTGQMVTIVDPKMSQTDPLKYPHAIDSDVYQEAFGKGIEGSKYDHYKAIISATPSQWSLFRSRTSFARVRTLLEMKGLWFEHNPSAPDILSFDTSAFRGFEISGLSQGWQYVELNCFDNTDRWLKITIEVNDQSGVILSQPEVNRVITTLGPLKSGRTEHSPN